MPEGKKPDVITDFDIIHPGETQWQRNEQPKPGAKAQQRPAEVVVAKPVEVAPAKRRRRRRPPGGNLQRPPSQEPDRPRHVDAGAFTKLQAQGDDVLAPRFLDRAVEKAVTKVVGTLASEVDAKLGPLSPFRRGKGSNQQSQVENSQKSGSDSRRRGR